MIIYEEAALSDYSYAYGAGIDSLGIQITLIYHH
jgi:hypothetical protein